MSQLLVGVGYAVSARHSTPSEFGAFVAAVGVATVVAGGADFGQSQYLIREVASGRVDIDLHFRRILQKLASVFTASALFLAVVLGLAVAGQSELLRLTAETAMLADLLLASQAFQVPLRARALVGPVSVVILLDKIVCVLVTTSCVYLGVSGVRSLFAGLTAGLAFDVAACLRVAFRHPDTRPTSLGDISPGPLRAWAGAWQGASGYGVAAILASAQQLDVPILSASAGARAAGIYGAVSRWTNPLILPSSALAQVGIPHVAAATDTRSALRVLLRSAWLIAVGAAACTLAAVFAPFVTHEILGPKYGGSATVVALLALAVIPTLFAQPLAMLLQVRQLEVSVSWVLGVGLALRLGIVFGLGPVIGAFAAAVGVIGQQTASLVIFAFFVRRLVRSERKFIPHEAIASIANGDRDAQRVDET